MMKNKRQEKILEIIAESPVETQDELIEKLAQRGIVCTQSTISRDIKQLHLVKEPFRSGRYRYTQPQTNTESEFADRLQKILRICSLRCDCVNHLVVLKTMPGHGDAAGAALDAMDISEMVGCVSGDDTVLIVMREAQSARKLCREINLFLGQSPTPDGESTS